MSKQDRCGNLFKGLACVALLSLLLACPAVENPPLADVALEGVPNLSQHGPQFDAQHASDQLCAPIAAANSLIWLEGRQADQRAQIALVNTLAHYSYMATSPNAGTGPTGVLKGVEKYLLQTTRPEHTLEHAGWRSVPDRYRADSSVSLRWLHEGLNRTSAVWLNLGWYEQRLPGVYRRLGGHWVTLVGIRDGRLVLHDPAQPQSMQVSATLRPGGLLHSDESGWRWASRVLALATASNPFADSSTYIDGAIRLNLSPGTAKSAPVSQNPEVHPGL